MIAPKLNFKKLIRFIKADNEKLYSYYQEVEGYKWWRDDKLNFLIGVPLTDKKANFGITSHMDYNGLESNRGKIMWDKTRNTLFGKVNGDDRAGCYAIYELLKYAEYKPYVLLFDGEESGSTGANIFIKNQRKIEERMGINLIQQCNFFVALDRKGANEAIYYTSDNPDFKKFIHSFGYQEDDGLYSDITLLEGEFQKCGVNLSIGYENNHTNYEIIYLPVIEHTIERLRQLCDRMGKENLQFKYIDKDYRIYSYNYLWNKYDYNPNKKIGINSVKQNNFASTSTSFKDICDGCGKGAYVKDVTDEYNINTYRLCKKCRKKLHKGTLTLFGLENDTKLLTNPKQIDVKNCDDCGEIIPEGKEICLYGSYYVCETCAESISDYMP